MLMLTPPTTISGFVKTLSEPSGNRHLVELSRPVISSWRLYPARIPSLIIPLFHSRPPKADKSADISGEGWRDFLRIEEMVWR